jgi:rhodanese-related sulfurtransferase
LFSQREGCIFVNEGAASARSWLGDHPETIVLDVRSAREFEGGGLPGAVNVSLGVSDFGERLAGWERDRPLLVYCAGGYRSRKAVSRLQELGFTHIHHLHRGYLSWKLVSSPPKASGGRRE